MDNLSGGTVGGAGGCLLILLVLGLIGGLVLAAVMPSLQAKLEQAQAERAYAQAETERAHAMVIEAQTEQQHQESVDWQHELMLYAITLKASSAGAGPFGWLVAIVGGMFTAFLLMSILMYKRE